VRLQDPLFLQPNVAVYINTGCGLQVKTYVLFSAELVRLT